MQRQTFKKLASLLVALSWLAQSFILAQPVKASAPGTTAAQFQPCDGSPLFFDGPNQGWIAEAKSPSFARVITQEYPPENPVGGKAIGLELNLEGDRKDYNNWAQFKIDLSRSEPGCAQGLSPDIPWWTEGSVLSLWVWAPEGTRGDNDFGNGLHLYLEDDKYRKYYGTWQTFQENTWFEVTFKLDRNPPTPACSYMDSEFDFDRIRALGLNISLNADRPSPIHEKLWISPLQIKSGVLTPPASEHLYEFEAETNELPQWGIVTDPSWGARAFRGSHIQDGVLVIDTDFQEDDEPHRKGVMDLVYAPDLHLRDADPLETYISLDIKFDPPPNLTQANCPFSLMLWAFDNEQKIQFSSINQSVGSGDWTRVGFKLGDLMPSGQAPYPGARLHPDRIGKIGFQIYDTKDGYDYEGKIWLDNIAIGGSVGDLEPPNLPFVTTADSHFMVGGQRFRFVGANAEYLPYKPDDITIQILDRAQALGIGVIRTWGFGEGCEDYSLADCVELSPYFQPRAGFYNKSAFEHFDRIVYEAGQRHIRLIVPLANNWAEYGGIPRYVCWQTPTRDPADCNVRRMKYTDHDRFYTDPTIRELYKQYVKYFVTHRNTITGKTYAEDPTIMAWELINEPRAQSNPSGEDLHAWIREMSDYLGWLAPQQLIGIGEEGWYIKSQAQAYEFSLWQGFDQSYKNYWHYGVNWLSPGCSDDWGSNGTDFLSDHSKKPQTVEWQPWVGPDASGPTLRADRAGVPEVDYTTIHLYLSPEETGLSYAPYCFYHGLDSLCSSQFDTTQSKERKEVHQAREWIQQHVDTAHNDLHQPFILEEFNFPVPWRNPIEGLVEPDGNQFQVSPEERARLFQQYLDMAYNMDIDGVMFWNLGYDGFMQQPWDEIPALRNWKGNVAGNVYPETTGSIRLIYSPAEEQNSMQVDNPRVDWLRADDEHVLVDLVNRGDAQEAVVEVKLAGNHMPRSQTFSIQPGANQFLLDDLFVSVPKAEGACPVPKEEPPLVTRITITLRKMSSPGSVTFSFRTFFNDKYVIYPGDPVESVVHTAAQRWAQVPDPVVPPKVTIHPGLTCGKEIHVTRTTAPLSIAFDLQGGLEHPDGYYYRYSIAGPLGRSELNFGSLGQAKMGQISVIANAAGKYEVKIAPEGKSLELKETATCDFRVVNTPLFDLSGVRVDNEGIQLPADFYAPDISWTRRTREIEVHLAYRKGFSSGFSVGCQLLQENKSVDQQWFACQNPAEGVHATINGHLPPGQYDLQLWSQDESSIRSEPIIIHFDIPEPLYGYVVLALVLLTAIILIWQRTRLRALLSRITSRKSNASDVN